MSNWLRSFHEYFLIVGGWLIIGVNADGRTSSYQFAVASKHSLAIIAAAGIDIRQNELLGLKERTTYNLK